MKSEINIFKLYKITLLPVGLVGALSPYKEAIWEVKLKFRGVWWLSNQNKWNLVCDLFTRESQLLGFKPWNDSIFSNNWSSIASSHKNILARFHHSKPLYVIKITLSDAVVKNILKLVFHSPTMFLGLEYGGGRVSGGGCGLSLRHLFPLTLLELDLPGLEQERESRNLECGTLLEHLKKLPFLCLCLLLFWLSLKMVGIQKLAHLWAHIYGFLTEDSPGNSRWSLRWEIPFSL